MSILYHLKKKIWKSVYKSRKARYSIILQDNYQKAFDNQNRHLIALLQNTELIRQGLSRDTRQYEYAKRIHEALCIEELDVKDGYSYRERLGRKNDGGYVVHKCLTQNRILYSFGIANDVSFESDMAKRGYSCFMYDHTIDKLPVENEAFHWEKKGIAGLEETDSLFFLDTLMSGNGHQNQSHMFLKMDVEGAEWDFIDHASSELLDRFDQMVLEIHDILSIENIPHMVLLLEKLQKTHAIFHIHANNNGKIWATDNLITPDVLEISLINRKLSKLRKNTIVFPIAGIDEPTVEYSEDICLGTWNT